MRCDAMRFIFIQIFFIEQKKIFFRKFFNPGNISKTFDVKKKFKKKLKKLR